MENHGEVCLEEEVNRLRRSGMSVREISKSTGLTPEWVAEQVEMFQDGDPSGTDEDCA